MIKLLNGKDWKLEGFLPDSHIYNRESGIDFKIWPIIQEIPCEVPGSVHNDLFCAGIIKDPYYDFGALECEWVENKEWRYFKEFSIEKEELHKHADIILDGLNCDARIYLNKKLLGIHRNVHTTCRFSIDGMLLENNMIEILLEHTQQDEAQMGSTKACCLQTERFAYSWDFSTRLVGVGVWKDVKIFTYENVKFDDVYITTDYVDGYGLINVKSKICGKKEAKLKYTVSYGDELIDNKEICVDNINEYNIKIIDPKLWFPNGYGKQCLYKVKIELICDDVVEEIKTYNVGIRRLEHLKNDNSPSDALNYTVAINGIKIYLSGVNFIPLDQMLGVMTKERYDENLKRLKDANVTLIRLWGGGIRENEYFFDLCDKYGILVWQDFTQSNSGLDGEPNVSEEFMSILKDSAIEIIKTCRNHTATAIYTGGNELMAPHSRDPVTFDNINIQMLDGLVSEYDSQRYFHSSSPSGPDTRVGEKILVNPTPTKYNFHGHWGYLGSEFHYKFYNEASYLYQGEFGVNGCSDEDTLRRFMSDKYLEGYKTHDAMWTYRNGRWWNSYHRECEIFGKENVDTIERNVSASQLMQAEGMRYVIERNRNRAYECSGNNIWTYNEPWPNPNNGNIVDFYMRPKQVYYTVKNCYAKYNINMRYTKIFYEKGEKLDFSINVSNFSESKDVIANIEIRTRHNTILMKSYELTLKAYGATFVDNIENLVDNSYEDIFFVRLTLTSQDEESLAENLYIYGTSKTTPYKPLFDCESKISTKVLQNGVEREVEITNIGDDVALFLNMYSPDTNSFETSDNYITLFPCESKKVIVSGLGDKALRIKDFTRTQNILVE